MRGLSAPSLHWSAYPLIALLAASTSAQAAWNIQKDDDGTHVSTFSESGGMLSVMCMLRHGRCQWAVVMPEADCKVGTHVPLSIKGKHGNLIVSAACKSMPKIGEMPGSGRLLMIDAPSNMVESAVSTQDTTISVRMASGKFIEHAFASQGAEQAMGEAGRWMRYLYGRPSSSSIYPPRNEYIGNTDAVIKEKSK